MQDIDDLINGLGRRRQAEEKASTRVKKAWIAERTCPEILPFAANDIEMVVMQIKNLIAYIDEHSYGIEHSTRKNIKFDLLIVETELERMKYLVRTYLRTRLTKIDRLIVWYSNPNNQDNLSASEAEYAVKNFQIQLNLFNSSFLSSWPEHFQDLQSQSSEGLVDAPDLTKPVVVRALRDTFIGDDEVRRGEIWMTRYDSVKEYIGADLELI